jgi:23S rRNA (guanosine2251-2'-O)-methyltransferase
MADYLYGINPVAEALAGSGRRPLELLLADNNRQPRLDTLRRQATAQQVGIRQLDRQDLTRLIGHDRHQGVLLRLEPFCYLSLEELLAHWRRSERDAFFLILDGITDPYNFGALVRSAEGAGCHGVIVAKDRACPVTPVVEKTAAGALAHLPLCQVTNLARTLEELKRAGVWCYGLAGETPAKDLFAVSLEGPVALVVGSEGEGLRANIRKHCDVLLAIPMGGALSSLNASVAAGVALFEIVRQRRKNLGTEPAQG